MYNPSQNLVYHRQEEHATHYDRNMVPYYQPVTHVDYINSTHTDLIERRIPYIERTTQVVPIDNIEYIPVNHREYVSLYEDQPREELYYEPVTHSEVNPIYHTQLEERQQITYVPHETIQVDEHIDKIVDNIVDNIVDIKNKNVLIRFINTISNSKNVDIYINNNLLLNNFGYDNNSEYYNINYLNNINIQILDTISNRKLYNKNINVDNGEYTIFIHGSVLQNIPIDLLIFKDNNSCPVLEMSKIRIINSNAESGNLSYQIYNLYIDDLTYGKFSSYINLPSGVHNIKLTHNNKLVISTNINIEKKGIYTFYTIGYETNNENKLKLKILKDKIC